VISPVRQRCDHDHISSSHVPGPAAVARRLNPAKAVTGDQRGTVWAHRERWPDRARRRPPHARNMTGARIAQEYEAWLAESEYSADEPHRFATLAARRENRWLGCPIRRIVTAIEASGSTMSGDRWDRPRASSVVPGRRGLLGRCGHGPYESRLHRPRDRVPQRGRAGDHVGGALGSKPPDGRWLPGHRRCRRATPAAREWQGRTGAAGGSAIRRTVTVVLSVYQLKVSATERSTTQPNRSPKTPWRGRRRPRPGGPGPAGRGRSSEPSLPAVRAEGPEVPLGVADREAP
jgi:hypothetical protein